MNKTNPIIDAQLRADASVAAMRHRLVFSCAARKVSGYAQQAMIYLSPYAVGIAGYWPVRQMMLNRLKKR